MAQTAEPIQDETSAAGASSGGVSSKPAPVKSAPGNGASGNGASGNGASGNGAAAHAASGNGASASGSSASHVGKHVCPFCGALVQKPEERCPRCSMQNTPLTRKATRARVGPWYVLQSRNPSSPGMKYGTLLNAIHKGRVTARSVIRGPTTHQLWRFAARVKGISRHFGVCYYCGSPLAATSVLCAKCKKSQEVPANPDVLLEIEGPLPAPTLMPRKISPLIEPEVIEPVPAKVEIAVAPPAIESAPVIELLPLIEPAPQTTKLQAMETEPKSPSPAQESAPNSETFETVEDDSEPFEPEADFEPPRNLAPAPAAAVLPAFSRENEEEARELDHSRARTMPLAPETARVERSELDRPMARDLTAKDLAAAFSLRYDPRTDRPLAPSRSKMRMALLAALVLFCVGGVAAGLFVPQVHDWVMSGWRAVMPPATAVGKPVMLPAIPMPVNSPATLPSDAGNDVVFGADAAAASTNKDLQNSAAAPTTRGDANEEAAPDPVAAATEWRSRGMDAEARGDYSTAAYDYEQVEKLPVANWPVDIDVKLANARKMFENQVKGK